MISHNVAWRYLLPIEHSVPHELDSDPNPPYHPRALYPSPARPHKAAVFSPLQVPAVLLDRQPSVQAVPADLPHGVKRKLEDDEPTARTSKVQQHRDKGTGWLLPAFDDIHSPSQHNIVVHRPPTAGSTLYTKSPTTCWVVSGDQWLPRKVSRPPTDHLLPSPRVRDHVRDILVIPQDRPSAKYGQSQGYVCEASHVPPDQSHQFSRSPLRAFAQEANHYAPYDMPTQMDYIQPVDESRYREDTLQEDPSR